MLYQRVRPEKLEDIAGNTSTVSAMSSLLESIPDMPHALLFHGPSGTGKTTLARIVAKRLDCGVLDILEINAAETRGIDTVRSLTQQAEISPLGKSKVIIMDEAHQLTSAAQNALLKSMEDAPTHCFWIICTTEMTGILKTIQNRCTILRTGLLRSNEMRTLLTQAASTILKDPLEPTIMDAIIKGSSGSPRQGLVILEKVAFMTSIDSAIEAALAGTGEAITPDIKDLCKLVISPGHGYEQWCRAREILKELKREDPETIRIAMLAYLRNALLRAEGPPGRVLSSSILLLDKILYNNTGHAIITAMVFEVCYAGIQD